MSDAIHALEQRVAALEQEVAELRRLLPAPPVAAASADDIVNRIPMLREARAQQPGIDAIIAQIFGDLLARVKPIGAEALQAMQEPYDPNRGWKTASQEIVEMREE